MRTPCGTTREEVERSAREGHARDRTTVIVVEVDPELRVPGYESWWDVAVAEVSEMAGVRESRARYETARKNERYHL